MDKNNKTIPVFLLDKIKKKSYTVVTVFIGALGFKKYNPYHGPDGRFASANGANNSSNTSDKTETKTSRNKTATYAQARDKIKGIELQDKTQVNLTKNAYSHIYKGHKEILKNKILESIIEELPKTKDMRITLDKDLKEAKCYVITKGKKKYGIFTEREVKDSVRDIITVYKLQNNFDEKQEERWGLYHAARNQNN